MVVRNPCQQVNYGSSSLNYDVWDDDDSMTGGGWPMSWMVLVDEKENNESERKERIRRKKGRETLMSSVSSLVSRVGNKQRR